MCFRCAFPWDHIPHYLIIRRSYSKPALNPEVAAALKALKERLRSQAEDRKPGRRAGKDQKLYGMEEALVNIKDQLKDAENRDRSIVLTLNLSLSKEHSNGIRGVLKFPVPVAKDVKLLVFAPPHLHQMALAAGAHIVGAEDLITPIIEERLEFNRCIATTDMLPTVAKVARILGPKGLMPNVKMGTLTTDLLPSIAATLNSVPFKVEKSNGLSNIAVSALSHSNENAIQNIRAVLGHILPMGKNVKKGKFIRSIYLSCHGAKGLQISEESYSGAANPKLIKERVVLLANSEARL